VDQSNQNTVANCSSGGLLWCAADEVWAFEQHTQEQAKVVVADFAQWLNTCQQKLLTLTRSISSSGTFEAIESICWSV
jgi:hypothetical protein